MTHADWHIHHKEIISQADTYNKWREEAKLNLLTNIGPRIAKFPNFNDRLVIRFGKLIVDLATPWQPCVHTCDKIEEQSINNIITKVLYDTVVEEIIYIEKAMLPIDK